MAQDWSRWVPKYAPGQVCSVQGCETSRRVGDLCNPCWQKRYRRQRRRPLSTCDVEGCETPAHCRGWCPKHYTRWRVHGDPLTTRPVGRPHNEGVCIVQGCNKPIYSVGLCVGHYGNRRAAARRARKLSTTIVKFTPGQLQQRLSMFGFRCWMCNGEMEAIEHVKPLAAGGAHVLANLRPACKSCNSRKGSRWRSPGQDMAAFLRTVIPTTDDSGRRNDGERTHHSSRKR